MFQNRIEELERQLILGHLSALWRYVGVVFSCQNNYLRLQYYGIRYIIMPKYKQDISNVYYVQMLSIWKQCMMKYHKKSRSFYSYVAEIKFFLSIFHEYDM